MPKLSQLKKTAAKETTSATVDYHGVKIALEWTIAALTGDVVQDLVDNEESPKALARVLANIVTKWDLTDDKDKVLPLDADTLVGLPLELLNQMMSDMKESARPAGKADGSFSDT